MASCFLYLKWIKEGRRKGGKRGKIEKGKKYGERNRGQE